VVRLRSGGETAEVAGALVTTRGVDAQVAPRSHAEPTDRARLEDVVQRAGLVERSCLDVEVSGTTRGGPRTRGATSGRLRVELPAVSDDEGHLLLVDEGGVLRWELPVASATRSSRSVTAFEVELSEAGPPAQRGVVVAVAKRVLRVFAFKRLDPVFGAVGNQFVRRWEERNRPYRLRTFTEEDYRRADVDALSPEAVRELLQGGPGLLLIHGTSSLSHSGFGLLPPEEVRGFNQRYRGRVLAFDHPTLGSDPKENAAWLAQHLPTDGALEVDVLCHSRGGLVARVLAERPSDVSLDPGILKLRSVTFVATPNSGTPLCDRSHLVDFVDAYTNLLDLIPDNPISDTANGLLELLKQLAVGAYGGLEGAMAMDPAGPFLAWLNQPCQTRCLYRAVAADYEPPSGAPVARSLRDRLLDRVFGGEANDLIVPTSGAYGWNGGSRFPVRERIVLPGDRAVDHSSYWVATEALAAFRTWLTPEAPGTLPTELAPLQKVEPREADPLADVDRLLARGDVEGLRAALGGLEDRALESLRESVGELALERFLHGGGRRKHGTVMLLNGLMGSNLFAVDGDQADHIWVNPWRLANGELRRLRVGAERVQVAGMHRSYLPLLMKLDEYWDVIPFAFDWRLSLAASAEKLARFITDRVRRPVHVVAHSMGGLVARRLMADFGELWRRVGDEPRHERAGRLVMLGTPNFGTFAAPLILTGKDRSVQGLVRVDVRNSPREIQEIFGGFPGIYDLLPAPMQGEGDELFEPATWGDVPVVPDLLEAAAKTHRALEAAVDPDRMLCVLGSGHDTPCQLRVDGPGRFAYRLTRGGDGRVPHERGQLPGAAVFYAGAGHAELARDPSVLAALDDLLFTGSTRSLPSTSPGRLRSAGGEQARWWLPEEPADQPLTRSEVPVVRTPSPSAPRRELQQEVVTGVSDYVATSVSPGRPIATLALRVFHASLEHASHPVLVGHYSGAPLAGSEGFLDRRLQRRLTNRQIAGLYPEDLGDVIVVPGTRDRRPEGAVVVGLGPRGDLTPTVLSRAVTNAVLAYALSVGEVLEAATAPASAGLSTVLVGSHSGDGLSVETSVLAIVEGTVAAIRLLADHPIGSRVRLDEVEFVEVYAQRASRAARALRYAARSLPPDLAASVDLQTEEFVGQGEGGRSGDLPGDYGHGSWRRLVVTAADGGSAQSAPGQDPYVALDFTFMGSRARADQLTQPLERHLLTTMVAGALEAQPHDQRFNCALYELLLPVDLKRDLAAAQNLHLVLDDRTADFPWELLANRLPRDRIDALALRAGMLRQLCLTERRHIPLQARENSALVIGNPPGGRGFPDLPGAAEEAAEVAELLRQAYGADAVTDLIFDEQADPGTTASQVAVAVLDGDFRVLHIAAHGHFEEPAGPGQVPLGGVVIGQDGAYLTATTIGQMRQPPDLVFLNCCHLGRVGALAIGEEEAAERAFTRRNLNRLAASLARELMAMGVRAVVAAGWPVGDYAAKVFAKVLYQCLLDGKAYGDAVKEARAAAFEAERGSNTWAAYQCYGDPAFRLSPPPRVTTAVGGDAVAPHELVRLLHDITVEAGDQESEPARLLAAVQDLRKTLPEAWKRAEVLVAFGKAYGELGQLRDAIGCYESALTAGAAELPLRAIEQLANFKVRLATELYRAAAGEGGTGASGDAAAEISRLFADAEHWLTLLLREIGKTDERLALLGSLYKRWAVAGDRSRLRTAIGYYSQARAPYARMNALQLRALWDDDPDQELKASIEACQTWFASYSPTDEFDTYWDRVARVDCQLTQALADQTLPERVSELRDAYFTVFDERSTPRERASTSDHVLDLADLAGGDLKEALLRLHSQLRDWRRSPLEMFAAPDGGP
jgi:CHAT domain-containing protein